MVSLGGKESTPVVCPSRRACYTRAEHLRQKQEELHARRQDESGGLKEGGEGRGGEEEDETSDSEELDFDGFLDWRAKIS